MKKFISGLLAVCSLQLSATTSLANNSATNNLNFSQENSIELSGSKNNSEVLLAQGINCRAIEQFGNSYSSYLLNGINRKVTGLSHRISRRKKLIVNQIDGISFQGCRLSLAANMTLKRKIRRDAHGTVKMRGDIVSFDPSRRRICYQNAKVTSVNLSKTLNIGERIYKAVANRVLPNGDCIDI